MRMRSSAGRSTSANAGSRNGYRRRKRHTGLIVGLVVFLFAAAVTAGVVTLGSRVNSIETIYPNVYVNDVAVGGMTYEEAADKLAAIQAADADVGVTVLLSNDVELKITKKDAGFITTDTDLARAAYDYGRSKGYFGRIAAYLRCLSGPQVILGNDNSQFDEENVRALIHEAARQANTTGLENVFTVSDTEVRIVKGAQGTVVDEEAVYTLVHDALTAGNFGALTYVPENTNPQPIDLQEVYETVYAEPVSAKYDPETQAATESSVGVSFDLPMAQALYDSAAEGSSVTIPLIITEPEMDTETLNGLLFRDVLATRETSLRTSSSNRINNVSIAASTINNLVLQPGDVFSFNGVVGKRTAEKGYKLAGAYVGGETVDQIGGGICQVSSTIYYCTLIAQLETVERSCHRFSVAYLPLGMDATVNWGTLDFKFRNSSEYPVRIIAYVEGKKLHVDLIGTKTDTNTVKLDYVLLETFPYQTVEEEDLTLAPGKSEVKTSGHTGYLVETYRFVYDENGNLLSKTKISSSKYSPQNRVILMGPAVEETPSPSVSPEVTPSADPSPSASVTPTPTPSDTPDSTPTPSPSPSDTPDTTPTPSDTPDSTPTPDPTPTPDSTATPDPTPTPGDEGE